MMVVILSWDRRKRLWHTCVGAGPARWSLRHGWRGNPSAWRPSRGFEGQSLPLNFEIRLFDVLRFIIHRLPSPEQDANAKVCLRPSKFNEPSSQW